VTLRPCLDCGTPSDGPRCPAHTTTTKQRPKGHIHTNTTRWKNLSKRLRKLSPFCELCGAREQLSVDHILPVSEAPELVFAEENLRVGCLSCNGSRGNRFTHDEAHAVLKRLESAYNRRPTAKGRQCVTVAQRLAQTRGGTPSDQDSRPGGRPSLRMRPKV
jgi:5-methylcytosine-specific restriction endonuclease McrA